MAPKAAAVSSRNITEFFKPYTIPKDRVPRRDIEDEIIVAGSSSPTKTHKQRSDPVAFSKKQDASPILQQRLVSTSPVKRGPRRPRKDGSASPSKLRLETRLKDAALRATTPARRSPRNQISDKDGAYDMLPPTSSLTPLQSTQSTPTKVRHMEAVEIPTPRKQSPMSKPEEAKKVMTSFSSLSSVPISSQSSSRRITKKGILAVTNSDSASMSSSSDDELMDFDALIPRKKRKLTPPDGDSSYATGGNSTAKGTRTSLRQSNGRAAASGAWKPPSPPPTASYKFSLAKLVKQHDREAANEAKIADAEARVQEAERLRREKEDKVLQEVDGMAMAAAYAENSDEGERMKQAIERTEALRGEETFHFFRGETDVDMVAQLSSKDLEASGLGFMKDDTRRSYACTSGFLAAIAFRQGLPDAVAKWLQQSILSEPSEELCESYVAALEGLVQGGHGLSEPVFSLSEAYAGQTFRDVEDVRPRYTRQYTLPSNLRHALKAMSALAPVVESLDQASALAELILLNNDDQFRQSPSLQIDLEDSLNAILASNDPSGLPSLYQQTTRQILTASAISRPLLARALASLPATTLPLHNLRRHLTLHFLLETPATSPLDPCDPETGTRLLHHLHHNPQFAISENTNYTHLLSLTTLLSIALDAGFSTFAFLPTNPNPISTLSTNNNKPSTPFPFSSNPTTRLSPDEAAFNAQIDAFTLRLRAMAGKIRDAGTSHLQRTEAKSALERLAVKLEGCVRTRGKVRRGIFDGGEKEVMRGFLAGGGKAGGGKVRFLEPGGAEEGKCEAQEEKDGVKEEKGAGNAAARGVDRSADSDATMALKGEDGGDANAGAGHDAKAGASG